MALPERVISLFYGSTAIISDVALTAQPTLTDQSAEHILRLEAFFNKAWILLNDYAYSATCIEEVFETASLINSLIRDELSLLDQFLSEDRIKEFMDFSKHDDWLRRDPLGRDGIPLMPLTEEKEQSLLEMVEGRKETRGDLKRIISHIQQIPITHRIKSFFTYPAVLSQWNELTFEIANELGWIPKDAILYLKSPHMSLSQQQISLEFDENNKVKIELTFFPETADGKEITAKLGHHEFIIRTGTPAGAGFWFDMKKICTVRIH